MLNKAADQISTLLAEMLAHVRTGNASSASMRSMLDTCKAVNAQLAALQTTAAAAIARLEDHNDGGAATLRSSTGVSARQARRNIDTAEFLGRIPAVREAVEEGEITFANAAALAEASRKTTPEAVQTDPELLEQARKMPQDTFAKQARRWAARRQHDHGEADHKRLRARRSLRFWNGDDGMTHLRGMFDPVTGERIRNRLEHIAAGLRRDDRKQARKGAENAPSVRSGGSRSSLSGEGGSEPAAAGRPRRLDRRGSGRGPGGLDSRCRSFDQCTADALDQLITATSTNPASSRPGNANDSSCGGSCGEGILPQPVADILVYADIAALQPGSPGSGGGFAAEIAGGGPIPPSVLERLMCNARVTGLLFDGPGQPLWCGRSRRTASAAQLKALRLRDRGCVDCGADPGRCQAHHIDPWRLGGETDIDNLVLVCYECHHRIHDDGWQITATPDHQHALIPPTPPQPPRDIAQPESHPGAPAHTPRQTPALQKHPLAHATPHPGVPICPECAQPPDRNLPLLC